MQKTNVMRLLDKAHIEYKVFNYELSMDDFDGIKVAEILNLDPNKCFKTLSLKADKDLYILCIPVNKKIDLKKGAANIGVKHLEMIHVKDLLKEVGYQRGETSPIGITKRHKVYFDSSILNCEDVEISGGKMGVSIMLKRDDLIAYTKAEISDLCREEE